MQGAQQLAEFDRVLTHELTHAMLRSVAPRNLPAWLNERLAMYCEPLNDSNGSLHRHPHLVRRDADAEGVAA